MKTSNQISRWSAECEPRWYLRTDGQTDRHDESNGRHYT